MAGRNGQVKLSARKRAPNPCLEHEAEIAMLERRIGQLEHERDEARQGIEMLTAALRRQGCCDASDGEPGHSL